MRTIVAGSRTIDRYSYVASAIAEAPWVITEILSGGAHGVDEYGEAYAHFNRIPLKIMSPHWNTMESFDPDIGRKRNIEMVESADALVAVWDGKSRGTAHMIETAKEKGLLVHVKKV